MKANCKRQIKSITWGMPFTKTFLLLILITVVGCKSNHKEVSSFASKYPFDVKVIEKLPMYDSLAAAILHEYPLFINTIKDKEAVQAFRYKHGSFDMDASNKLPDGIDPKIKTYYAQLGDDYIDGFDLYKDSSLKIYIRNRESSADQIRIDEFLSYYPIPKSMRKREFPTKDTTLSKHWQYWIRFNPQDLF